MEQIMNEYQRPISTCRYKGKKPGVYQHYSWHHRVEKIEKYMKKAYECDEGNFRFSHSQSLHVHKKKYQEIFKNRIIRELKLLANHDIKPTHLVQEPIVIQCDIRVQVVWEELHTQQLLRTGKLFRAVVMDPHDKQIKEIPMNLIQDKGYLFMLITNAKPEAALSFYKKHGYRWVETIVWIKTNKNGKVYRGPKRYIQHGFELCLAGVKGIYENIKQFSKMKASLNVTVEPQRSMSHKPEGIYKILEKHVLQGLYLEIFGRPHNIKRGWTTMGNQL